MSHYDSYLAPKCRGFGVSHICALRLELGRDLVRVSPPDNRQPTTENVLSFRLSEGVQQTIALLL
jgi:hypothetical protein